MIVICQYCKRQRINEQWEIAPAPYFGAIVSHGTCPECYVREMKAIGFTDEEIAEDLKDLI